MFCFWKKPFWFTKGFESYHIDLGSKSHQKALNRFFLIKEPCTFSLHYSGSRLEGMLRRGDGSFVTMDTNGITFYPGDIVRIEVRNCILHSQSGYRHMISTLVVAVAELQGAMNEPDPGILFTHERVYMSGRSFIECLQKGKLEPVA